MTSVLTESQQELLRHFDNEWQRLMNQPHGPQIHLRHDTFPEYVALFRDLEVLIDQVKDHRPPHVVSTYRHLMHAQRSAMQTVNSDRIPEWAHDIVRHSDNDIDAYYRIKHHQEVYIKSAGALIDISNHPGLKELLMNQFRDNFPIIQYSETMFPGRVPLKFTRQ